VTFEELPFSKMSIRGFYFALIEKV